MTHGTPNFSQVEVDHYRSELNGRGHRRVQAMDCRQFHVFIDGQSKPLLRVVEQFEVFDFSLVGVPVQGIDNLLNLLGRGKLILVQEDTPCIVYKEAARYESQVDPSHPITNREHHPATADGGALPRAPAPPTAPAPPPPAPATTAPLVAPEPPAGAAQTGDQSQGDGSAA